MYAGGGKTVRRKWCCKCGCGFVDIVIVEKRKGCDKVNVVGENQESHGNRGKETKKGGKCVLFWFCPIWKVWWCRPSTIGNIKFWRTSQNTESTTDNDKHREQSKSQKYKLLQIRKLRVVWCGIEIKKNKSFFYTNANLSYHQVSYTRYSTL